MKLIKVAILVFVTLVLADLVSGTCKCGSYAFCKTDGTCECRNGYTGDPYFACYSPARSYFCGVANDPEITLFDGQNSSVKLPQSACLTSLTTKRIAIGGGKCDFSVSTWTKRYGAKYYIAGMEFILKQRRGDGETFVTKYRITSSVDENGDYEWIIRRYVSENHWEPTVMNKNHKRVIYKVFHNCRIYFIRSRDNFLLISVRCCRVLVALRPHNPIDPKTIPGIWIAAPKWTEHFNKLPLNLCNNVKSSQDIDHLVKQFAFKHKYQYMTYVALAYGVPLDFEGVFRDLIKLQQTLIFCNTFRRSRLFLQADFMFTFGRLINCLGADIMDLVYSVAKGYCLHNGKSCLEAMSTIRQRCPKLINENVKLKRFFRRGCY